MAQRDRFYVSVFRLRLPQKRKKSGGGQFFVSGDNFSNNLQNQLAKRGYYGYITSMIEVSTTQTLNEFHQLLKLVDRGESIRITNHGKARARIVRDFGFMSGAEFSQVFDGWKSSEMDRAAADEIEKNIVALDKEGQDALAH